MHAIVLTLVRLAVTRRRLLEWETAAVEHRAIERADRAQGRLERFAARDDGQPDHRGDRDARWSLISRRRNLALGAARSSLLWFDGARPSRTGSACRSVRAQRPLVDAERALLRWTARKTWRYFETFVTAADGVAAARQLPGDRERSAAGRRGRRPTNIAMGLLSTLAAHDLGYLSTTERWSRGSIGRLTTLEGLERHEGHFLNWYDTTTLAPLAPALRVDRRQRQPGGGAHRAQRRVCGTVAHVPQTETARCWKASIDTAAVLASTTSRSDAERRPAPAGGRASTSSPGRSPISARKAHRRRRVRARCETRQPGPGGSRAACRRASTTTSAFWSRALVDAIAGAASRPGARRPAAGRARRAGTARVGAGRCDALRVPVRPAAPHLHDRLPPRRRRRSRPRRRRRSTICWRRKRAWPASSRSPRATCRSITGSISAGSSRTSTVARR